MLNISNLKKKDGTICGRIICGKTLQAPNLLV